MFQWVHATLLLSAVLMFATSSSAQNQAKTQDASAAVKDILSQAIAQQNNPDEFFQIVARARARALELHDVPGEAVALRWKAQMLQKIGKPREAADNWKKEAEISMELQSSGNTAYALGQCALLESSFAPADADATLSQLLQFAGKNRDDPQTVAKFLSDLAQQYRDGNDFRRADRLSQAVADIETSLDPNSSESAMALDSAGSVLIDLGDLAQAEALLVRALSIFERVAPNSTNLAIVLNNLASVAQKRDQFDKAEHYFLQALAIKERTAPDSLTLSTAYNNLGQFYLARGRFADARSMLVKSLAIREEKAPDTTLMVNLLTNLGEVEKSEGNLDAGRRDLQRALDIEHKISQGSMQEAELLNWISVLEDAAKDEPKALEFSLRAWKIVLAQREQVEDTDELEKFENQNWYIGYNLSYMQVLNHKPGEAFSTMEQLRAFSLEQIMWEQRTLLQGLTPEEASAYRKGRIALHDDQIELEKASNAFDVSRQKLDEEKAKGPAASGALIAKLQNDLEDKSRDVQAAQSEFAAGRIRAHEIRKRSSANMVPGFDSLDVQKTLSEEGTYFISYCLQSASPFVFIAMGGKAVRVGAWPLAVKVERYANTAQNLDLARAVREFKALTSAPDADPQEIAAKGRQLYQVLFPEPVRKLIQSPHRLIISPEGLLWSLPFAALVTNDSGDPTYLGLETPITYTQSFAVFRQSRLMPDTAKAATLKVLSVGGIIVDNPTAFDGASDLFQFAHLEPLKASKREAEAVAALYGSSALTGPAGTKQEVAREITDADVIHLATHGLFDTLHPMSSGLVFSASPHAKNGEQSDRVLQAWEIVDQLKLKAELVVLSACETGRGQTTESEGLIGLTRAFQAAGARSVVASLWSVSDESTKDLMVHLHVELRSGKAIDEALRLAMQNLHSQPGLSLPYYWAPFVLFGDPDNLHLAENQRKVDARQAHANHMSVN
jgi:CHAT domain-containing protein